MESLLDFVERGARQVSRDFADPDDDWMPVLFVKNAEGNVNIVAIPMEDKDMTAAMIGMAIRVMEGVEAVLLTSAWGVKYDKGTSKEEMENEYLPPSMQEDRQEVLMLTYVGKGVEAKFIPIIRHANKPPTLGEAEKHHEIEGRFVEAMRKGLA